jgi:hypothetical protein
MGKTLLSFPLKLSPCFELNRLFLLRTACLLFCLFLLLSTGNTRRGQCFLSSLFVSSYKIEKETMTHVTDSSKTSIVGRFIMTRKRQQTQEY